MLLRCKEYNNYAGIFSKLCDAGDLGNIVRQNLPHMRCYAEEQTINTNEFNSNHYYNTER